MIDVSKILNVSMIHDISYVYESVFEKLMTPEYYNDKYKSLIKELEYVSHCINLYTFITTIQEYDGRFHDEGYMKNYGLEAIKGDVKYIIVYSNYGHSSIFPSMFVSDVNDMLKELITLRGLMKNIIIDIYDNFNTLYQLIDNPPDIDEVMKDYISLFNIDGCKSVKIETLLGFIKLYSMLLKYYGMNFSDEFVNLYSQAVDNYYTLKSKLYCISYLYFNSDKEHQGRCIALPMLYRNYYVDYIVNLGLQYRFTRMLLEKRCI